MPHAVSTVPEGNKEVLSQLPHDRNMAAGVARVTRHKHQDDHIGDPFSS